jgi:TRAP-type mannitol/chloroaromatic compound transport system permease small subunit
MRALLAASNVVNRLLERIADATGWLFLALAGVIFFDVITRKFGFQIPGFGSTMLQELEWHLHAVIFSLWMGFNYVINGHPRVDSYTEPLSLRGKAWVELAGCLVFALPYCAVLVWYGIWFVQVSYVTGEVSEAPTGLPHRWVLKTIFFVGIVLLMVSVLSMVARLCVFLFASKQLAAQANLPIDKKVESI